MLTEFLRDHPVRELLAGGTRVLFPPADDRRAWEEIPEGCGTRVIPGSFWAQFPCTLRTLQDTNTKIWSEWLPSLKGYTLAGEYDIEVYLPPEEGSQDSKVYIWVPLKKA